MSDEDFFEKVGTQASPKGKREQPRGGLGATQAPTDEDGTPLSDLSQGNKTWTNTDSKFFRVGETYPMLPPGIYRCGVSSSIGLYFDKITNDTDKLIVFPDSASSELLEEIRKFQGMKDKFKKHGFLHKRGVLMWGPPGSGKTTTLQLLIKFILDEHKGVAVFIDNPTVAGHCLAMLRQLEAERQIIGILEDLDALVERYGESEFLALLDGESQVNNVIYIGTTNYPERLDKRFVDRPSRFDTIKYIGMPSPAAREVYFRAKIEDIAADEVRAYVEASEGYSVAHMRELVILTKCFEHSLADAKIRLDKTQKQKLSSSKKPGAPTAGFGEGLAKAS